MVTAVPVKIRTSERTALMRCEQRWYWAYVDLLKPLARSAPLTFGDLVHQALAGWYLPEPPRSKREKPKRGPHPAATFLDIYDRGQFDFGWGDTDHYVDARERGEEMLVNYVEFWGDDRRYRIVAPEIPFQIPIVHNKRTIATYVGTCDALMQDLETGQYGFLETKTAKSISTVHLSFDEQAGSYWTYGPALLRKMGLLQHDEDVDFILYNFLRKGAKDPRPVDDMGRALNKNGTVSKQQPAPLFSRKPVRRAMHERKMLHKRVIAQAAIMADLRSGKREPIKSVLNGCAGMYKCEFRDMCEIHEQGGDWEEFRDLTMETWEPYEIHEGRDDNEAA